MRDLSGAELNPADAPGVRASPPRAAAAAVGSESVGTGLRGKVVRGVGWNLLGQIFTQISTASAGVLLAHLLEPRDFGLAAMALVFTAFAGVFTDLALGAALVQRPSISESDRSTAFWTSLVAGLVLTSVVVGLAPTIAGFFSQPSATPLFAATAALFMLSSLSVTQSALLTREMNFKDLSIRGMVATLAGIAVAIPLAFAGAGAWTIVVQNLVAASISAVLLWRLSRWRPTFTYSLESLRTLGSFSSKTLVSQFLGYLSLNVDNLLVGRYLGSGPLGFYSVSYNTMFLPVSRISQPIQRVLFSALAKLQHEPVRLREAWARGNQVISAVNVPAFLGMAVVAPDFVPVVLGQRWDAAVPVLQLLSVAGVATTLQTLNWSTVQAAGRPEVMLRLRLFSVPLTIAAFAVGLRWGVVGVAGLFAVARFIVLPVSAAVTCRTLGCSLAWALRGEAVVAALSVVMAASVYLVRIGLVDLHVSAATRLGLVVALGIAVYAGLTARLAPVLVSELRSLGRSVRSPR